MSWMTVAVMAAAAYAVKLVGFGLRPRDAGTPAPDLGSTFASRLVGLLPAALFSGLVVTQALTAGSAVDVLTRVVGVAAAAVVAVRTRSLTPTLVMAALVTAGLRLLF